MLTESVLPGHNRGRPRWRGMPLRGTTSRNARGSGGGVPGKLEVSRKQNKAGTSLKQKEMSIYDRAIKVLGNKKVGDIALREACKNKPNGPKPCYSKQLKAFGRKQTQRSYLFCRLLVTAKMWPLFRKFECGRPINDFGPLPFDALHPPTRLARIVN